MSAVIQPGFEPSAIHSYFNANMPLRDVLAELIDNSFDANAEKIQINIDKNGLSVLDDGDGIEELDHLFRIGKSGQQSNFSSIGQYGVGAKHALLAVGAITDVCSNSDDDLFYEARVDWSKMAVNGFTPIKVNYTTNWLKLRKDNGNAMVNDWSTIVSVKAPHKRKGRLIKSAPSLLKSLAIRYRPALLAGKKIMLYINGKEEDLSKHKAVSPGFARGTMIAKDIEVNGKKAKVTAAEAIDHVPGMTGVLLISYGNRIIESPNMIDGNTLDRKVFAQVELETDWKTSFTTHKDRVNSDREELMQAVWEVISGIANDLRKQKRLLHMEMMLDNIGSELQKGLQQLNLEGHEGLDDDDDGGKPTEGTRKPGKKTGKKGAKRRTRKKKVVDGDKQTNRKKVSKPVTLNAKIEPVSNKDEGFTQVFCTISKAHANLIVRINVGDETVNNLYEERGTSFQLIIVNALAQYFMSDEGKESGETLFRHALPDPEQESTVRYGLFCKKLLTKTKPPAPVTKSDMDF